MKSLTRKELKEVIHEIIRELQEASTTGNIAGYETPKAFAGGLKKNKDLKAKLIKKLHSTFKFPHHPRWEIHILGFFHYLFKDTR